MHYGSLGSDGYGSLGATPAEATAKMTKFLKGAVTGLQKKGASPTAEPETPGFLSTTVFGLPLWMVAVGGLGVLLILKRRKGRATVITG